LEKDKGKDNQKSGLLQLLQLQLEKHEERSFGHLVI